MLDSRLTSLSCYVLPGHVRSCKAQYLDRYNFVYDFWRVFMGYEMRNENLSDIDEKLSSDAFMLFEDIYALFYESPYEKSIVGIFCFDTKDVRSKAILDQSYFKSYPQEVVEGYILKVNKIMTIGHLLVHPNWRRSKIGIGLSDILVWFMHKRFVESSADLMIYWTRNNRGTNALGKKFGGQAIMENLEYGGLDADIIVIKPEEVVLDCGDEVVNEFSQHLWDHRKIAVIEDPLNKNRSPKVFRP